MLKTRFPFFAATSPVLVCVCVYMYVCVHVHVCGPCFTVAQWHTESLCRKHFIWFDSNTIYTIHNKKAYPICSLAAMLILTFEREIWKIKVLNVILILNKIICMLQCLQISSGLMLNWKWQNFGNWWMTKQYVFLLIHKW